MPASTIKDRARALVEALPEDATWDDLIQQVNVCEAIDEGLQDADAGRLTDTAKVRAELGLPG